MSGSRLNSRSGEVDPRELIRQFAAAWEAALREGSNPPFIDEFADAFSGSEPEERARLLLELVQIDMHFRSRRGEEVTVGWYLDRFPLLVDQVSTLDAVGGPVTPGLLDGDRGQGADSTADPQLRLGTVVAGRYRLEELVGSGGMGIVYRAWDVQLEREVAIKTIRLDLLQRLELRDRFRREAKLCAVLQHPGVPAVHELGSLPDGRPFLAMTLVRGRTLRELLARRQGTDEETWRLVGIVERVAQTVAYAHANGIVHRDLKPTNIMVGAHGEVQVMDWGLAKSIGQGESTGAGQRSTTQETVGGDDACVEPPSTLTQPAGELPTDDGAVRTVPGAVMGTPSYAAPEQVRGELERVGPASDVFSLGAILCEVLTGAPPYGHVARAGGDATERIARGELAEAFEALDRCDAEPELVRLCCECLRPDPEDRLADAGLVSQRLARIRDTVAERARQAELERARALVREEEARRRRRIMVAATAATLLVLLAGLAGTTVGFLRAREQQRLAEVARQREALQRRRAEENARRALAAAEAEKAARQAAERNLTFARRAYRLLGSVFNNLSTDSAYETVADFRRTLRQSVLRAIEQLEEQELGEPYDVAALRTELGVALTSLGDAKTAIEHLQLAYQTQRDVLGPEHPDTLRALNGLALAYAAIGDLSNAERLLKQVVQLRTEVLGRDHPDTLAAMGSLGSVYVSQGKYRDAVPLLQETIRLAEAAGDQRLGPMSTLATVLFQLGQTDEALRLAEQVLKLTEEAVGPDHTATARALNNLAAFYMRTGQRKQAAALLRRAYEIVSVQLGADHPTTLQIMANLAAVHLSQGDLSRAADWLRRAYHLQRQRLGPDDVRTLRTAMILAGVLSQEQGDQEALPLLEQAAAGLRAQLGISHGDTLEAYARLGDCYLRLGRHQDAVRVCKEVLQALEEGEISSDRDTLIGLNNVAFVLLDARAAGEAARIFEHVVRERERLFGKKHPAVVRALGNLGAALWHAGRLSEAAETMERAVALARQVHGEDDPNTLAWTETLVRIHTEAGQVERAIELGEQVLARVIRLKGQDSLDAAASRYNLALAYQRAGQTDRARELLKQAADLIAQHGPTGAWALKALALAADLHEQVGRYAEAERWRRVRMRFHESRPNTPPLLLAAEYDALVLNLQAQEKFAEALELASKSVAIRQKHAPDAWLTHNARGLLARSLAGMALARPQGEQRRSELLRAEQMLVAAIAAMRDTKTTLPEPVQRRHLTRLVRGLIEVYRALERDEELRRWERELAKLAGEADEGAEE